MDWDRTRYLGTYTDTWSVFTGIIEIMPSVAIEAAIVR